MCPSHNTAESKLKRRFFAEAKDENAQKTGHQCTFFGAAWFFLEKRLSKKCCLSTSLNNANRKKKRYAVCSTHSGFKW